MSRSSSRRTQRTLRPAIAAAVAPALARPAPRRAPFVAAIGLSAFLLFSLELLAGRLVLPVFGGTPGVWTTSLCFFTTILFVGYGYAHLVATRLTPRIGGLLQIGLALVSIALTVAAPSDVASLRMPGMAEAVNVLLALLVIAGGAAFVLGSTTPLLSAWYAGRGGDPWWLYAASNAASFAALLAYPFLIEPFVGLSAQRLIVAVGLAGYAGLVGYIAWDARRRLAPIVETRRQPTPSLGWRRQILWLATAAVPAGLLSATTNFLQTDLLAAPFIWVGPLAIYLVSFVVAFSAVGRRALPVFERLVPGAATLLWIPFVHPFGWPAIAILVVELGSFLVLAVAIHGRLALDRPDTANLTRFYLVISAGGLIATTFVALVASQIFSTINEYPLLIVAGVGVLALLQGRAARWLPDVRSRPRRSIVELGWRVLPYLLVSGVLYALLTAGDPAETAAIGGLLLIGVVAVSVAVTPRLAAIVTPVVIVIALLINAPNAAQSQQLVQVRTFFGVLQVRALAGIHTEYSGTTLHGLQFTDAKHGTPTTYYAPSGPLGNVFDDLRQRSSAPSIGVVGLGVGTMAAYEKAGDAMTFFEIDPAVTRIAHDPAYFTFLRDAAVAPRIVDGDGRLSLQAIPAGSFDLLVLDAFSSDAVPPHLLTREAFATYVRTLRPGGVLAFNVSNRYYDLPRALAATARTMGLEAANREYTPDETALEQQGAFSSNWVVVGARADISRFLPGGWALIRGGGPVLTDDYPDLTRVLRVFGR